MSGHPTLTQSTVETVDRYVLWNLAVTEKIRFIKKINVIFMELQ